MMTPQQAYIAAAIAVAGVVVVLVALRVGRRRKGKALTGLTGLALAFVLAGIAFGGNRLIGYGLLGIGVLLAVVDLVRKAGRSKIDKSRQQA
jgi:phosphatidylglycerophosphate synthase